MSMDELEKIRQQLDRINNTVHPNTLLPLENIIKSIVPEPIQTVQRLQKALEPIISISKTIDRMVNGIDLQFKSFFEKIHIPTISDERKEQLRLSFSTWGECGWTLPPNAELDVFVSPPNTLAEADRTMLPYCDKTSLLALWQKTKEIKGVKIKDFEEAIFSFESKKYKSCAMMLLSLIDAKLIRMQRKEDRNTNGKRKSGIGAIKKIEKRIEKENDINKKCLLLLSYANLFACLKAVFADGNDFKVQPKLVNRNFVDHGMLTRNVRKRDCIQLFLLYFNFLEFFEIINS